MIQSKLNVGTTIFTRMSQLAAECGAINLSQGFPDFDGPPGCASGRPAYRRRHNQYAPMTGLPACASRWRRRSSSSMDAG